jgi:hypothetical protein
LVLLTACPSGLDGSGQWSAVGGLVEGANFYLLISQPKV